MSDQTIQNICAIGTGVMGAGTALSFALGGYNVYLCGRNEDNLNKCIANIGSSLQSLRRYGLIPESKIDKTLQLIHPTTDLKKVAKSSDLVIESIAEDLKVKQAVFATLDSLCSSHTIFTTNTSALSPTKIAEPINRKDKFVVTHFWNPPHLLRLVEVVPGKDTSPETMDIACGILTNISKKPVRVNKESPGFIGNVLQCALLQAACGLVESGIATPDDVDTVARETFGRHLAVVGPLRSAGMGDVPGSSISSRLQCALLQAARGLVESGIATPEDVDTVARETLGRRLSVTGPIMSADMGGLDIFKAIFETLSVPFPAMLKNAVETGRLGAKTGQGIFPWPPETLALYRASREAALAKHLLSDSADKREEPPPSKETFSSYVA